MLQPTAQGANEHNREPEFDSPHYLNYDQNELQHFIRWSEEAQKDAQYTKVSERTRGPSVARQMRILEGS